MMFNDGLKSSATDNWSTPQDFFNALDNKYHFTVDACASAENAKCKYYYTKEQNGLAQEWQGVVWCNPPYGRTIGQWIKKGYEAAKNGAVVVMLLPARTDTAWFHDYCTKGKIKFIRGKLKFRGARNSAPFPSMIVVFPKEAEAIG